MERTAVLGAGLVSLATIASVLLLLVGGCVVALFGACVALPLTVAVLIREWEMESDAAR